MSRIQYYPRAIEDRVLDASAQFPVLLVTGPRQVGKTTLLQHLCGDERRYVTLDDPARRLAAMEDPALFLQRLPPPVLIDEIQYAPGLLPYIKMAVDASGSPGDFWLTGSQHFQAMRDITETLAGRVAIINLLGFSRREGEQRPARLEPFLPEPVRIEERTATAGDSAVGPVFSTAWRGSFPAHVAGPIHDRDLFYSSYLQTYLQRDVRDLTQVGSQESFMRFLRACAARTAQLLNLSDLARDVDISVPTAKSWLSILEASFQVFLLRPFHSNVTKRLIKTPKLYFLDTGLAAYLTEWSSPETLGAGAMAGAFIETHVVAEVIKSFWHRLRQPGIYFYRDRDGKEIDLVLAHDGELHAIEVKLAATPNRRWAGQFGVLDRLSIPVASRTVICLCREALPIGRGASALPVGAI